MQNPEYKKIDKKAFFYTFLVCALWINASEVFRYFTFVMPMMRDYLQQIDDVAPMNLNVFFVWGIWDTILTFAVTGFTWIFLDRFPANFKNTVLAGCFFWISIFGIFWLALLNMNLASTEIILYALPFSWIEIVIAAFIVRWAKARFTES
jgi:hypothetical protein